MNQLQCMRVFVEVVDRNSFGRAAHALRMATATVSVQVASLEAHLGTRLLYRTTRSVTPTEEGKEYYAHCKRVLDEIAGMEASLSRTKAFPRGRLRVDADESYVCGLLVPVLPEFLARYPDVHIDFVYSGHLFDTCDVGADVMLRMFVTEHEAAGVVAQPIGHTQLVCVASPAYLEEHGTPRTPHDLTLHRCLMFIDTLSGRRWEWRFERGEESIVLDFPDAIGFAHRFARIAAAARGLGILYEEKCYVAAQLADGKLRPVLEDWAWASPRSYIVYGPKRLDNDKVQAFVDFVLEKYPPDRPIAAF